VTSNASPRARRPLGAPRVRGEAGATRGRAEAGAAKRPDTLPSKDSDGGPAWLARWWKVALLVALATIGLPFAHALFGEWTAMLGGALLLGFLLGRWTAR